jgi:hypothetical protein
MTADPHDLLLAYKPDESIYTGGNYATGGRDIDPDGYFTDFTSRLQAFVEGGAHHLVGGAHHLVGGAPRAHPRVEFETMMLTLPRIEDSDDDDDNNDDDSDDDNDIMKEVVATGGECDKKMLLDELAIGTNLLEFVIGGASRPDNVAESDPVLQKFILGNYIEEADMAEPVLGGYMAEPDMAEPDMAEPVVEPDMAEPVVEPDMAEPVVEPDIAEPVAEPVAEPLADTTSILDYITGPAQ